MQQRTKRKRDVGADITALGTSMAPVTEPNLPAGVVSIAHAGGGRAIMPEQALAREQEQAERWELIKHSLTAWLPPARARGQAMQVRPREARHFLELTSTQMVWAMVKAALDFDWPTLVLGYAGTGKTTALLHYSAEHNALYCHASHALQDRQGPV